MAWLVANWFWVLIFIAFFAMHTFGHSGHGIHGGHGVGDRPRVGDEGEKDEAQDRGVDAGLVFPIYKLFTRRWEAPTSQ